MISDSSIYWAHVTVASDEIIDYAFVNPDYTNRLESDEFEKIKGNKIPIILNYKLY